MNLLLAMTMIMLSSCLKTDSVDYEWKYHRTNRLYEETISENAYLRAEMKKCKCQIKAEK